MVIAINDVIELKKELYEKFDIALHLHDACGAQSFSFDRPIDEDAKKYICEYARMHGAKVMFSDDRKSFVIPN